MNQKTALKRFFEGPVFPESSCPEKVPSGCLGCSPQATLTLTP